MISPPLKTTFKSTAVGAYSRAFLYAVARNIKAPQRFTIPPEQFFDLQRKFPTGSIIIGKSIDTSTNSYYTTQVRFRTRRCNNDSKQTGYCS